MNSDYKNQRVEDPTQISSRQERQVKKYVQDYFEKAVAKKKEHDEKRAERKAKGADSAGALELALGPNVKRDEDVSDGDQIMALSDTEEAKQTQGSVTPVTPLDQLLIAEGLKRKRETEDDLGSIDQEGMSATPSKRLKSESPPPPPPPPPATELTIDLPEDGPQNSLTDGESPIKVNSMGLNAHHPPPPPPPLESPSTSQLLNDGFVTKDDMGIPSNAHPEKDGAEHERRFPGHRRQQLAELQV